MDLARMQTRGREGVKIPRSLWTSFEYDPEGAATKRAKTVINFLGSNKKEKTERRKEGNPAQNGDTLHFACGEKSWHH